MTPRLNPTFAGRDKSGINNLFYRLFFRSQKSTKGDAIKTVE